MEKWLIKTRRLLIANGLIILIASLFFIIPLISGVNDVSLSYDVHNESKVIFIDETAKIIAKAELNTPLKDNYVNIGQDRVVFSFNVENLEDYASAIGNMKIINLHDNRTITKSHKIVYGVYGVVVVDDYGSICKEIEDNKTLEKIEECTAGLIGNHNETQIVEWKELTESTLLKGNITIGLMTDVEEGDKFDAVPTLFSKSIDAWVSWEAAVLDAHGQAQPNNAPANNYWGIRIRTKCDLRVVRFGLNPLGSPKGCHIVQNQTTNDADTATLLGTGTINPTKSNCEFSTPIEIANNSVVILITNGTWAGDGYKNIETTTTSYPYIGTNINWIGGCAESTGSAVQCSNNPVNFVYAAQVVNITTQCQSAADTELPYFSFIPSMINISYTQGFGVDFNGSDAVGLANYSINWTTKFQINDSGFLENKTQLSAGHYWINVSLRDTSNNANSTIFEVYVNKSIGLISLYVNASHSGFVATNEEAGANVWINGSLTQGSGNVEIYRNGTLEINASSPAEVMINLTKGTYNITAKYLGNENWTKKDAFIDVSINLPLIFYGGTGTPLTENKTLSDQIKDVITSTEKRPYLVYGLGALVIFLVFFGKKTKVVEMTKKRR